MASQIARRVVFQPTASRALQQGIHKVVNAIRPTLGPRPRLVALQRVSLSSAPELLDDAGLIARRIIELPDRNEDMGAMLVRELLWHVRERAGDGSATAAVLFHSIYDQGLACIAGGCDAVQLRRHLEQGSHVILAELSSMTAPIGGQERLVQFAGTVCHDPELARLFGEIFDIIGEYGSLEIRAGRGRDLEREYVEGMYFDGGPLSREMLPGPNQRAEMEEPAILISDLSVEDPQELVLIVESLVRSGTRSLLLIAQNVSSACIGLLTANNRQGTLNVVAVKAPYVGALQKGTLQDLALLTGGRAILEAAGERLRGVKAGDLGHARRAWANRDYFGIIGGRGDPRALRRYLAELRSAYGATKETDARLELRKRIGKLLGGSATLWIGANTETEIEVRKALAERTAEALRGAMLEGVVPGGGAALVDCRPALRRRLLASASLEERAACRILLRALEEPMRTIVSNAGCDPAAVLGAVELAGSGSGFEVHSERVANMREAGILDSASATGTAVASAISSAALALTTDVLVHHAKPRSALAP